MSAAFGFAFIGFMFLAIACLVVEGFGIVLDKGAIVNRSALCALTCVGLAVVCMFVAIISGVLRAVQ